VGEELTGLHSSFLFFSFFDFRFGPEFAFSFYCCKVKQTYLEEGGKGCLGTKRSM